MEKHTRQKLFNDGIKKECGKCHKIKLHRSFSKRQGRLRSICDKCRNILNLIKNYKKKLRVIIENYDSKCSNCNASIEKLPSLEFHHLDPKSKLYSWRSLRGRPYSKIIDLLHKDNVVVLCKNCHIMISSIVFKQFKKLILQSSLFLSNPEEINKSIDRSLICSDFVKTKTHQAKYYKSHVKYIIKKWIKKRYVVERLFNGKCIGCQEIKFDNNLPSLGFHHTLPSKKDKIIKWDKISKYSIKKITSLLIDEKCVCLCSNCHSMIHSKTFRSNINEILGDNVKSLIPRIISDYNKIEKNIKNYIAENYDRNNSIRDIF